MKNLDVVVYNRTTKTFGSHSESGKVLLYGHDSPFFKEGWCEEVTRNFFTDAMCFRLVRDLSEAEQKSILNKGWIRVK